jgi:hypothetical protein
MRERRNRIGMTDEVVASARARPPWWGVIGV